MDTNFLVGFSLLILMVPTFTVVLWEVLKFTEMHFNE